MLKKTKEITKDGRSIYVDEKGKKQVLPRVHYKQFSVSIPGWCWNYIHPIKPTANHWDLKRDCMVLR